MPTSRTPVEFPTLAPDRVPFLRLLLLALGGLVLLQNGAALADSHGHRHDEPARAVRLSQGAVAHPNVRLEVFYDYLDVGEVDTSDPVGLGTLDIGSHDAHAGRAALTAVVPIWGPLGARAQARSAYGHRQRSLDGLGRGNNEIFAYGAGLELFLRDPGLGAITLGGDWDDLNGEGSLGATEFGGHVDIDVFFPDLGLGPIDWNLGFAYTHRDVTGTGTAVDFDGDRFVADFLSGVYVNDNLRVGFGVRWDRAEDEFTSTEDIEALVEARWFLPLPIVPVELRVGGSGGVSEFKQSPFRGDRRNVFGVQAGLVFRFGAGRTLLETQRHYD